MRYSRNLGYALIPAVLALCHSFSARGDISDEPDFSFLWNTFNTVAVADSFAVATSDYGLALLRFDFDRYLFQPVCQIPLENTPVAVRLCDDVAVTWDETSNVHFYDLSGRPDIVQLGSLSLDVEIRDLTLTDMDLYIASGFDGLHHFRLPDFSHPGVTDSIVLGIHLIQVQMVGRHLFVLDDYNGVLHFELDEAGKPILLDVTYLPERVGSFQMAGGDLYCPIIDEFACFYRQDDSSDSVDIERLDLQVRPARMFGTEHFAVALDPHMCIMEVIGLGEGPTGGSKFVTWSHTLDIRPAGDTYGLGWGDQLLLVSGVSGLVSFDLDNATEPVPAYSIPGPITALDFHGGRLATGGPGIPLQFYAMDSTGQPESKTPIYAADYVSATVNAGDRIYVGYPDTDRIYALRVGAGSIDTVDAIESGISTIRKLKFFEYPAVDSLSLLVILGLNQIRLLTMGPDGRLELAGSALVPETLADTLADAIVVDSVLIAMTDGPICTYQILETLELELRSVVGEAAEYPTQHMVVTGLREPDDGGPMLPSVILSFAGNQMSRIVIRNVGGRVSPVGYPIGPIPVDVLNSVIVDNCIYTIGEQGLGKIHLGYDMPQMVDHNEHGGSLIAYHDSVLACSDGQAVLLYSVDPRTPTSVEIDPDLSLLQQITLQANYPNPFNASTTIPITIPSRAEVQLTVYNVLGQTIARLIDRPLSAGEYTFTWDGKDEHDQAMASGVYLYKLTTGEYSRTRKMVLLK